MFPPWHELKQAEIQALRSRGAGSMGADVIETLRRLFEDCRHATDAEEAICYHGALALISEFDGEINNAIEHRRIEISKIQALQELARRNPGDRPALVNYGTTDLALRKRILESLQDQTAR